MFIGNTDELLLNLQLLLILNLPQSALSNKYTITTAAMKRKRYQHPTLLHTRPPLTTLRSPSPQPDEAAKQQLNKKPRKEPANFLSLPHEIRQQIFFNINPRSYSFSASTRRWADLNKIKFEIKHL